MPDQNQPDLKSLEQRIISGLLMRRLSCAIMVTALSALAACEPVTMTTITAKPIDLTGAMTEAAQIAIIENLTNPSAAQFRELHGYSLSNGQNLVCGEVNAKDRSGADLGFKRFFVTLAPDNSVLIWANADVLATLYCASAATGSLQARA